MLSHLPARKWPTDPARACNPYTRDRQSGPRPTLPAGATVAAATASGVGMTLDAPSKRGRGTHTRFREA